MRRPSGFDREPGYGEQLRSDAPVEDTRHREASFGDSERPQEAVTSDLSEVFVHVDGFAQARPDAPTPKGLAKLWTGQTDDPVTAAEKRVKDAARQVKKREKRERRRFSAASRKRKRVWLISGVAVLSLALFVFVGVFTPLMSVRTIEIDGAVAANPADIEQALTRFAGTPLALVPDADVAQALEPFPLIERYAVERIPPETLRVRIVERVPVIAVEADGAFRLYDAAGVLVGAADARPEGVALAEGRVVDLQSEAFASAATVLRDVPWDLRAQIVSVSGASGQDTVLNLTSGVEVMWGGADLNARKAIVLTSILNSLAGTPVSYVDVSSTEAPVFR